MSFISYAKLMVLVVAMSGCTSRYHLRRAQHHLEKAKEKGSSQTSDTVYVEKTVLVEGIKTDTVFTPIHGDTVTIVKDNLTIKYVKLPGEKVYIKGEVKRDTIVIKVPVSVENNFKAPPPKVTVLQAVLYSIGSLIIGLVIGFFLSKLFP